MADNILGDIRPVEPRRPSSDHERHDDDRDRNPESDESIVGDGGSQHDRTRHPGSRDVTEGTTGGTGTEVGGSRNFRTGTGATGGDLGNRPE
ncbi:MAG TPA: hypothetical protein VM032_16690 [Vicinamibacterales bacterium]|nr:hypothetical protein [Vicinamibacterales bacterium]